MDSFCSDIEPFVQLVTMSINFFIFSPYTTVPGVCGSFDLLE